MKILFIPSTQPSVKLMSSLAAWLSARGHESGLVVNQDQQVYLRSLGVPKHGVLDFKTLIPVPSSHWQRGAGQPDTTESKNSRSVAAREGWLSRMHRSPRTVAIAVLSLYWVLQILRFRWLWRRRVSGLGCRAAFIWGDNAGTTNGELLNLLRAHGAKLVHLPIALTDQNIIARLRAGSPALRCDAGSSGLSRWLVRLYPDQGFDFEGCRLFYYHPSEIVAMALLSTLPAKPWLLGGSRADYIGLSDTAQREYWRVRGQEQAKVRLIGHLDLQEVVQDRRRLMRTYPDVFVPVKPLILVNMPNLVEHNVIRDWSEFWHEVQKMLEPLLHAQVSLVINLHPKADKANYAGLTQTYQALVTQSDIAAWIGLADLYISVCSTTELIAAEMQVPVLDLGPIYGFESDVLKALPGIQFFNAYEDYGLEVKSRLQTLISGAKQSGPRSWYPESETNTPYGKIMHLIEREIL